MYVSKKVSTFVKVFILARSHGLKWLRRVAHDQEFVGSNPDWMDVSDASYYITENYRNKGSQMGNTKKYKKDIYYSLQMEII
jgi:hypothetical protein